MTYPTGGFDPNSLILNGWENYNDTGGSQSLTNGVFNKLTNDGLGSVTNTANKLPASTNIWNVSASQFDFAAGGLLIGDTVDIRFDVTMTLGSPNTEFALALDLGIGGAFPFSLEIERRAVKSAGSAPIVRWIGSFILDTNTLDNPGEVSLFTDAGINTVSVAGWYIRAMPRKPIVI